LEALTQLLASKLVPFAESERDHAIDPDDGLLYDALDAILSAAEHSPREIAQDCLAQLDALAAVIMSPHRHAEAQELAADLINRTRPPVQAVPP
jgi:adenosylmethionine-8-amino-7-oxononanoate aminotransferase